MSLKDFFKSKHDKREKEFYSHVSPEIRTLAERDEPITIKEWKELRSNSYERKLLHRNLSKELLMHLVDYYMSQCSVRTGEFYIPKDYNESLISEFIPLLIERLEQSSIDNIEKLDIKENDILFFRSTGNNDYYFLDSLSEVLPKGVQVICIHNNSFENMSDQSVDDMLTALKDKKLHVYKQNKHLIDRLREVLIRNRYEGVECPKCHSHFASNNRSAIESYEMYKEFFKKGE